MRSMTRLRGDALTRMASRCALALAVLLLGGAVSLRLWHQLDRLQPGGKAFVPAALESRPSPGRPPHVLAWAERHDRNGGVPTAPFKPERPPHDKSPAEPDMMSHLAASQPSMAGSRFDLPDAAILATGKRIHKTGLWPTARRTMRRLACLSGMWMGRVLPGRGAS